MSVNVFAEKQSAESVEANAEFYAVSVVKVIVMVIFSFGLYGFYWSYQSWSRYRRATGESVSPFWRSLFFLWFLYFY